MTQADKDLLLKDLCARLPYRVKCEDITLDFVGTMTDINMHDNMCKLYNDYGYNYTCYMMNCRPYLFPLSSMTKEQKKEFANLLVYSSSVEMIQITGESTYDWLNKNMFDWRGLIPKGLANDATNLGIY